VAVVVKSLVVVAVAVSVTERVAVDAAGVTVTTA